MVLTCKQYPQYCEYPNIICMDPNKRLIDVGIIDQKISSRSEQATRTLNSLIIRQVINSMCPTNQMLHKQLPCALRYIDSSHLSKKAPEIFINVIFFSCGKIQMYMAAFLTCVTPPSWPCKTYKASILLSAYTTVVWLYEPTASIPL